VVMAFMFDSLVLTSLFIAIGLGVFFGLMHQLLTAVGVATLWYLLAIGTVGIVLGGALALICATLLSTPGGEPVTLRHRTLVANWQLPRVAYLLYVAATILAVWLATSEPDALVVIGCCLLVCTLFDYRLFKPRHTSEPITLHYDVRCNLCNAYVAFLKQEAVYQGTDFQSIYHRLGNEREPGSIILQIGEREYTHSAAVLTHWQYLGGWLRVMAYLGALIPRPLRDTVYTWVGRNRYRWFGTCNGT
jgi:predicted DCC family thiol-disulfide oxidoreductase YuxK